MKQRKTRQTGFTLVELVIVILILGILSAVALPKFLDISSNARAAKLDAVFGAVRAASEIVHASALVNGVATTASGSTVAVEGATINLVYGYPEGTVAVTGIVNAAGMDTTASNNDKLTLSAATGVVTIQVQGAATPATCQVVYTAASSATTPPTIVKTAGGC